MNPRTTRTTRIHPNQRADWRPRRLARIALLLAIGVVACVGLLLAGAL